VEIKNKQKLSDRNQKKPLKEIFWKKMKKYFNQYLLLNR